MCRCCKVNSVALEVFSDTSCESSFVLWDFILQPCALARLQKLILIFFFWQNLLVKHPLTVKDSSETQTSVSTVYPTYCVFFLNHLTVFSTQLLDRLVILFAYFEECQLTARCVCFANISGKFVYKLACIIFLWILDPFSQLT